ncbi:hypothetical protein AK812_SmicGene46535, partial [Symbiodinium microadriaticum]
MLISNDGYWLFCGIRGLRHQWALLAGVAFPEGAMASNRDLSLKNDKANLDGYDFSGRFARAKCRVFLLRTEKKTDIIIIIIIIIMA